jgi:hypothetical protein
VEQWASSAAATGTFANVAQGTAVKISSGTGAGQLDFSTGGMVKSDVIQISSSATAPANLEALMANVSAGAYSSAAYSTGCREFLTKAPGANSAVALDLMVERIYQLMFNKINITDADGSIAIRNAANSADACTGSVTDNATTTARSSMTWL